MKLKEKIEELQYRIMYKITTAGTPQYNGVVERAFATLYGRIRAMLNSAKLSKSIRGWLWAECAMVAIRTSNMLVDKYDKKCAHENFCRVKPGYSKHL